MAVWLWCLLTFWVTLALLLQLEKWDSLLWYYLHWTNKGHFTCQFRKGNAELLNLRTLATCFSQLQISLLSLKTCTAIEWLPYCEFCKKQCNMFCSSYVRYGDKADHSCLVVFCSQFDCSLQHTTSQWQAPMQLSPLLSPYSKGLFKPRCFLINSGSPFLQYVKHLPFFSFLEHDGSPMSVPFSIVSFLNIVISLNFTAYWAPRQCKTESSAFFLPGLKLIWLTLWGKVGYKFKVQLLQILVWE